MTNKQSSIGAINAYKDLKTVDVNINKASNKIKNNIDNVPCELSTNTYRTLLHVVTVMLQTLHYLQSMRQINKVLNNNKKLLN